MNSDVIIVIVEPNPIKATIIVAAEITAVVIKTN